MTVSARQVIDRAGRALFGKRLVTNTARGFLVEAMIAEALDPDWTWCAADYASWDFEKGNVRLEVKQSASLQSWNSETGKESACSFDIAARSKAWIDEAWIETGRRVADLYVFAHHPLTGAEADHREPSQWAFYVVPSSRLPDVGRISLSKVGTLAPAVSISNLLSVVTDASTSHARLA